MCEGLKAIHGVNAVLWHVGQNIRDFVVEGLTTNILPTNEATLPVVQTSTTKILPTKCLKIAEPRIFCPPKITRYTVLQTNKQTTNTRGAHARLSTVQVYMYMYNVHLYMQVYMYIYVATASYHYSLK